MDWRPRSFWPLWRRAPHLRLGARGERIAARALRRSGYRVVARNYRPGRRRSDAELDIVAWEGRTLAVVEVKTRRGGFGDPAERVDREKRRRIRRSAARMWRRESSRKRIPPGSRLRMDVVEVWFPPVRPGAEAGAPVFRPASPAGGWRRVTPARPGGVWRRMRLWNRMREALRRPVVRIRRDAF